MKNYREKRHYDHPATQSCQRTEKSSKQRTCENQRCEFKRAQFHSLRFMASHSLIRFTFLSVVRLAA